MSRAGKCSVCGLRVTRLRRGMCAKHYLAAGPVHPRKGLSVEDRFWAKVDKGDGSGCWLWTAGLNGPSGYGYFAVTRGHPRVAHRIAYELLVGPIPEGLDLDHVCHNLDDDCPGGKCAHRLCVNPAHLEPVTRGENLRRGKTLIAEQVARTECPQGHPYDDTNTGHSAGHRVCLTCRREYDRRRYLLHGRRDRKATA